MNHHRTYQLLATILLLLLLAGCSAPLPTATPQPEAVPPPTETAVPGARATATPLPSATSLPAPTATVAPPPTATPVAGYYRHPELGFWFTYPNDWFQEALGQNMPSVIITDSDDPVQLIAGGRAIEEGTDLDSFTEAVVDELGLAESIEWVTNESTTLNDGTPAKTITVRWTDEANDPHLGQGITAVTGTNGYAILLFGREEVIAARPNTIHAITAGLKLEQPELFGISRDNAIFLLTGEPHSLDPATTWAGADSIVSHIFSGLVKLDANLQIAPDLAERWETNADGTVYTFYLREDATFHNGRSFTADDVVASWNRATDPALNSPTAPLHLDDIVGVADRLDGKAGSISGIEAIDTHTLQVTLDAPKPYFLAKLTQPVTFITDPTNVAEGDNWWRTPSGTGAFTLSRWQPDQVIVLAKNEAHHLAPANIETAVYIIGASSFAAYEAGLVDFAQVSSWNLSRAQDPGEPLSADLVSGNLMCTRRVVFNTTQPPFDDPAIRKAFSLVVDRQQLAQLVLNNAAQPAVGVLPPGMPGFVERPSVPAFDVDEALALISTSSYGDATALPPLTFITNGAGTPSSLAVALANAWSTHLGISVETRLIADEVYNEKVAVEPGNLFTMDWCADYPDPENMLDLLYASDSPVNYGRYHNDEVDSLLTAARTEADPATRIDLYQQVEEILLADAASIQTVYPLSHVLVRPSISGYQHTLIPITWPALVTIEREEQ
ncbi:MAG: hypothetical protein GY943_13050 [Chloroflexi bacterium]|nr:hypothetical protein [Chloroflexota bacterium]